MKKKKLKNKDFFYPSSEEREYLIERIPNYQIFDFSSSHAMKSIFEEQKSLEEAKTIDNLYHWNICLSHRLIKLKESHINILFYSERGFLENPLKCNDKEIVNHFLFDYFAEIFYYYFFSTLDTLGQILHLYFELEISKKEKIYFNKNLINKIKDQNAHRVLYEFLEAICSAKEIRNSFAHRFPINIADHRADISEVGGNSRLSLKPGTKITSEILFADINAVSNMLSSLLVKLKEIFNDNKGNTADNYQ